MIPIPIGYEFKIISSLIIIISIIGIIKGLQINE